MTSNFLATEHIQSVTILKIKLAVKQSPAETTDTNVETADLEREAQTEKDHKRERVIIAQRKAELLADQRKEEKCGVQISDDLYKRFKSFSQSYSFREVDGPFWATFNHRIKGARKDNLTPKGLQNASAGERYMADFKAFIALFWKLYLTSCLLLRCSRSKVDC